MRFWRVALALFVAASPAGAAGRVAPVTVRLAPVTGYVGAAPSLTAGAFKGSPALSLSAPALTLAAPSLAPAPSVLPAAFLPAPAPAPAVPGADGAPAEAAARPLVFRSLQAFAAHVLAGRAGQAADQVFSGAKGREDAPYVDETGRRPSIPVGVRQVEVHSVASGRDVARWIPHGSNSDGLIEGLRASVSRMLPFDIYVYRDALGGSFAAVDLSKNPANADRHPELAPHESALIKKIQLWTKDLQVLVREEGKTPDLVVNGVVTELKSAHKQGDLDVTITAANEQVWKHAQRHGLGHGAIAVDLVGRDAVPTEHVLAKLNAFAGKSRNVGFARAYFFAGSDLKVFSLTKSGAFRLEDSPQPFGASFPVAPARARDVHRVQLLTKAGRLEGARAQLGKLETHAEDDPRVAEAREQLEAERVFRKISKLVSHGREREAHAVWDRFRASRPAAIVHQVAAKVSLTLKITIIPDAVAQAHVPDADVVVREITEPARQLRAKGIRATITAYGSARIKPPHVAAAALTAVEAETGLDPKDPAARKRLESARRDMAMSKYYDLAQRFGALVAKKGRGLVAVVTGGGPGIMEAANKGAYEAGGPSVGYNIILDHEQSANDYITKGLGFEFENFATRKIALRHGSMALTYFPGGFGTMDELFEVLTLMQTGKMPRVPIVLMGEKEYWDQILDFDEFARLGLISPGDLSLFAFAEDENEAWAAIERGVYSAR